MRGARFAGSDACKTNAATRRPRAGTIACVEGFLLQDFITVRAAASTQIVQTSSSWLDLGDLEDVVLYTDVREALNSGKLAFETSPSAVDSQFVPLVPAFTLGVGLQTNVVLASLAGVPPARYLRWRFQGVVGATAQATFRVWAASYRWA